jgi:replication factor A1
LEAEQIIEQLAEKSKRQPAEVRKLIGEKKEKFSGLLTDSGASFMVAKDLGIDLGLDSVKRVSVSQLKDGMQNVDLLVRVMQVFSPKEFEKKGKKGKLCNLVVADSTGEVRLTVWHDDVKKLSEQGVQRGTVLMLRNCYVKEFNEKPQLSLSYKGSFEANPGGISFEELPEAKSDLTKVFKLEDGMNDVNAVVRILRKFPVTEFSKAERKGKVMNFLVGDETGIVRATAWNDLVKEIEGLDENDLVGIEAGYTKQGLNGIELHLGWQARVQKKPALEGKIPEASELMKRDAESKKVLELKAGDNNVLVSGKIVLVNQGGLYYRICPTCSGKLQALDEGLVCDKCGEVNEAGIRAVVSVRLDDGSAQINAVAYGKEAEKVIGLEAAELKKQADERGREALIEELQALNGKGIEVLGRVKDNSFSGEIELVANNVEIK